MTRRVILFWDCNACSRLNYSCIPFNLLVWIDAHIYCLLLGQRLTIKEQFKDYYCFQFQVFVYLLKFRGPFYEWCWSKIEPSDFFFSKQRLKAEVNILESHHYGLLFVQYLFIDLTLELHIYFKRISTVGFTRSFKTKLLRGTEPSYQNENSYSVSR